MKALGPVSLSHSRILKTEAIRVVFHYTHHISYVTCTYSTLCSTVMISALSLMIGLLFISRICIIVVLKVLNNTFNTTTYK